MGFQPTPKYFHQVLRVCLFVAFLQLLLLITKACQRVDEWLASSFFALLVVAGATT